MMLSESARPLAPDGPPDRLGERGDDLGGQRLALAVQAREPRVGDAGDGDVAQRADRQRADDRLGAQLLAAGERDAAGVAGVQRDDRRAVADALAELLRQRERERGAAVAQPQALPAVVAVDLLRPGRGDHPQLAEHRLALDRAAAHRQGAEVVQPDHGRARALGAQPAGERERVEPGGVGMPPRVGGVDGRGELRHARLEPVGVRGVGGGEERREVALPGPLREVPAHQPGLGDVARLGLQPVLGREPEVGGVEVADQLAAHLDAAAVLEHDALDAAAGAVARLEDQRRRRRRGRGRARRRGRRGRRRGRGRRSCGRERLRASSRAGPRAARRRAGARARGPCAGRRPGRAGRRRRSRRRAAARRRAGRPRGTRRRRCRPRRPRRTSPRSARRAARRRRAAPRAGRPGATARATGPTRGRPCRGTGATGRSSTPAAAPALQPSSSACVVRRSPSSSNECSSASPSRASRVAKW